TPSTFQATAELALLVTVAVNCCVCNVEIEATVGVIATAGCAGEDCEPDALPLPPPEQAAHKPISSRMPAQDVRLHCAPCMIPGVLCSFVSFINRMIPVESFS